MRGSRPRPKWRHQTDAHSQVAKTLPVLAASAVQFYAQAMQSVG